jgi:hypothetical protein
LLEAETFPPHERCTREKVSPGCRLPQILQWAIKTPALRHCVTCWCHRFVAACVVFSFRSSVSHWAELHPSTRRTFDRLECY